ncbi:hypothetical protein L6452_14044 [Arctium lappa]|uniref:Uncharacterized protein n=1 Tax=Arctium lappa TaxID=4217 RepID=A0ACB9CJS3_ARCLA|nr:hypothetical protein L6452_14044 [Arctium lappa]
MKTKGVIAFFLAILFALALISSSITIAQAQTPPGRGPVRPQTPGQGCSGGWVALISSSVTIVQAQPQPGTRPTLSPPPNQGCSGGWGAWGGPCT